MRGPYRDAPGPEPLGHSLAVHYWHFLKPLAACVVYLRRGAGMAAHTTDTVLLELYSWTEGSSHPWDCPSLLAPPPALAATARFPRHSQWMTRPSATWAIGSWTRWPPTWTELPREPVYRPLPAEVRLELETMDIPAEGMAPDEVIENFLRLVLPYGRGQNHPCFAAFVDPAATKLSMLAAFASAVTNTSGAGGNYAAIYVERAVIRWLMELIGFPADGSDGVLLGGGSDANRHCLEVARYWGAQVNGWDIRDRRTARASAAHHVHVGRGPFLPGEGCFHARARGSPQGDGRGRFPHGPGRPAGGRRG